MSKQETRPGVPAPGRGEKQGQLSDWSDVSSNDFITGRQTAQGPISKFLFQGREQAIKGAELAALTGLDERSVRALISRERKAGVPILATTIDGYYLPDGIEDLRRFARSAAHRASEMREIAERAQDAVAEAEGQERLEGW